jgi:hypothetical protein
MFLMKISAVRLTFSRPDLEIELSDCQLTDGEQVLWRRFLDAIKVRPSFMNVNLTIRSREWFCVETVV